MNIDFNKVNIQSLRANARLKWANNDPDILSLSTGELDFPPPKEILDFIYKDLTDGKYFYGDLGGDIDVKNTLLEKLATFNQLNITPEQVILTPGTGFSLFLCYQILMKPGDEAIMVPGPMYQMANSSNEITGSKLHYCPCQTDFSIDFNQLKKMINRRTKALILCNPHNPLGKSYTKEELLLLVNIAHKHNLFIFSNEIYEDLIYSNEHISIASLNQDAQQRTFTFFGASKTFNFSGLRASYLVHQGKFASAIKSLLIKTSIHSSRLGQSALKASIIYKNPWVKELKNHLLTMRNYSLARLNEIPGITCHTPMAGYYLFPKYFDPAKNTFDIVKFLENTARVKLLPGTSFGPLGKNYFRINFGTSKAILEEAFDRIHQSLSNH